MVDGGMLRWSESRPAEGRSGRGARARCRRAHPAGGERPVSGARVRRRCLVVARRHPLLLRVRRRALYRVDPGAQPAAITPEGLQPHALRYADGRVTPDGTTIVCVRERHEGDDVHNELVALPTGRLRGASSRLRPGTTSTPRRESTRPARGSPGSAGTTRRCRGTGRSSGSRTSTAPAPSSSRRRRGVGARPAMEPGRRAAPSLRPHGLVEPLSRRHAADLARERRDRRAGVGVSDTRITRSSTTADRVHRHARRRRLARAPGPAERHARAGRARLDGLLVARRSRRSHRLHRGVADRACDPRDARPCNGTAGARSPLAGRRARPAIDSPCHARSSFRRARVPSRTRSTTRRRVRSGRVPRTNGRRYASSATAGPRPTRRRSSTSRSSTSRSGGSESSTSTIAAAPATAASTGGC